MRKFLAWLDDAPFPVQAAAMLSCILTFFFLWVAAIMATNGWGVIFGPLCLAAYVVLAYRMRDKR